MSAAQAWALVGTLVAAIFASVGVTTSLVLRVLDARFDQLLARIDALDRDLQRLYVRDGGES